MAKLIMIINQGMVWPVYADSSADVLKEKFTMFQSVAEVKSHNPERALKRLCNHWRHRFEINGDEDGRTVIDLGDRGVAEFTLQDDGLRALATHPEQDRLPTLENAIASHLQRFAKDETLAFDWQPVQ